MTPSEERPSLDPPPLAPPAQAQPAADAGYTHGDWLVLVFWLVCFALMWSKGLLAWFVAP
jgi:hypothetical protein